MIEATVWFMVICLVVGVLFVIFICFKAQKVREIKIEEKACSRHAKEHEMKNLKPANYIP
jgi:predicted histidine transporter YuiF (NhaC family)